jgi:hypothetical protein
VLFKDFSTVLIDFDLPRDFKSRIFQSFVKAADSGKQTAYSHYNPASFSRFNPTCPARRMMRFTSPFRRLIPQTP